MKFGFELEMLANVSAVSPYDIVISFNSSSSFQPVTWSQDINITIPANWFLHNVTIDPPFFIVTLYIDHPDSTLRWFADKMSIVAVLAGLGSGAGGWFFVANTQTSLLMAAHSCSPPHVSYIFPSAEYMIAPQHVLQSSNRFIFASAVIAGILLLTCHLLLVFLFNSCLTSEHSLVNTLRTLWFPYVYMLYGALTFLGVARSAYNGVIDDKTPYVRVFFFVSSTVYVGLFVFLWNMAMRRGYEGYFERYSHSPVDQSVTNPLWKKLLLPCGWWPSPRGYAVVRAQCHEKSCNFLFVSLWILFFHGINGSHISTDVDFCYSTYWTYCMLLSANILIFLFYLPFRIHIVNILWVLARLLDLSFSAIAAHYINSDRPDNILVDSMHQVAFAAVMVQLGVNAYTLVVCLVEMFYSWRMGEQLRENERNRFREEFATHHLHLPLLEGRSRSAVGAHWARHRRVRERLLERGCE